MDQYQESLPPREYAAKPAASADMLDSLRRQVHNQQRMIEDLQRDIKRLKVELRQAVNAFNSISGRNG